MPQDKITSKTGSASIKKTGHTANGKNGSDPNAKVVGRQEPRDLNLK